MPSIKPGDHLGPYVVSSSLKSRGGFAHVVVADWARADGRHEQVALKVARIEDPGHRRPDTESLQDSYDTAIDNEVSVLRRLKHPNIVRLYPIPFGLRNNPFIARATDVPGQPWFCALEYLSGGSLADLLDKEKRLAPEEAVEIAYQVGSALDHLHAKGVAHLDLKPDNILFRYPRKDARPLEAVLIDFGISKRSRQSGTEGGTASYMAPERIALERDESDASHADEDQRPADVFGLGVTLYEMLAGELPWRSRDRKSVQDSILRDAPRPLIQRNPAISRDLNDIVMSCLEKDADRRPTV